MRIGVQLLSLKPGQVGGQGVLVRRLLRHLVPRLGDDRLVLFLRPELAAEPACRRLGTQAGVEAVVENPEPHYGPGYADWNLRLLERAALDVVYFPLAFFYPRPLPWPVAVHVPDLLYEYLPECLPPAQLAWRRARIPESVALADAVVTSTRFTARTLREKLGAAEDKLHVIPPGGFARDELAAPVPAGGPGRRAGAAAPGAGPGPAGDAPATLPQRFILYPAADWPHKNHETLLGALARLARRGRGEHLVLTGLLAQRPATLRALAGKLKVSGRVHLLGSVSRRRLIELYRRARVMAFPSRFEGFGLPLVEAMQLGCPIVASRAAAVRETAGPAALFCDDDPAAWAEALAGVLDDARLRAALRRRGLARARRFDWRRCAAEHLALFHRLGRA